MMRFKGTDAFMTKSNWFDSQTILDGIRRWVEIETPTDTPEQVNRLISVIAVLLRDHGDQPGDLFRCVRRRLDFHPAADAIENGL